MEGYLRGNETPQGYIQKLFSTSVQTTYLLDGAIEPLCCKGFVPILHQSFLCNRPIIQYSPTVTNILAVTVIECPTHSSELTVNEVTSIPNRSKGKSFTMGFFQLLVQGSGIKELLVTNIHKIRYYYGSNWRTWHFPPHFKKKGAISKPHGMVKDYLSA